MSLSSSGTSIQRIAVIGAGPGGVSAAKGILTESHEASIDIFEQQASFGGVWNYSKDPNGTIDIPQVEPNQPLEQPFWHSKSAGDCPTNEERYPVFPSPMYEGLEANIPHSLMKYSDAPSFEAHELFPTREVVTKYLEEYAKDITRLVHFQTQVIDVRKKLEETQDRWVVQFKLLQSGILFERAYDAVVVANGHYSVPSLPDIKGIKDWNHLYPGIISHSKSYRRPEPFTDQKVIIVGNSASGVDIASQIATCCRHPILNSTRSNSPLAYEATYKENVSEIVDFLPPAHGTRAVRFSNGRIERDIDAIIFCTGYYYAFPFLSSITPKLISTGERVQHLYKHLFYIPDPTLAFIGLPSNIIPFRTFQGQSAVIARVWAHRLKLPPKCEMREWEANVMAQRGSGKPFHVLPFPKDFEYHNGMVAWASNAHGRPDGVPPKWTEKETWLRERIPAIKQAFAAKGEERHAFKTVEELGFDYDAWLTGQGVEAGHSRDPVCDVKRCL